jgi:hypothetical protein
MNTMKGYLLPLIICIFISAAAGSAADTVLFKSGKKLEGAITARDDKTVTVDLSGVTEMTYDLKDIDSINGEPVVTAEKEVTGSFSPLTPRPDDEQILKTIEAKALKQPAVPLSAKVPKVSSVQFLQIRLILGLLFYIYFSLCLYMVANRLHDDNSARAWLPGLNIYLMFDIAALKPAWIWVSYAACCGLLVFPGLAFTGIPGLLTVIFAWLYTIALTTFAWMRIAANMGKPTWLGLLTVVPVVNLFVLGYFAFSDSKENMELV